MVHSDHDDFRQRSNLLQTVWKVSLAFLAQPLLLAALLHMPVRAEEAPLETGRLPDAVVPVSYRINVEPSFEKGSFAGNESIRVTVTKPTQTITLNAAELRISALELSPSAPRSSPIKAKFAYQPESERLEIRAAHELAQGSYTINIGFLGSLNDKLRGFYRSSFTDTTGKKQWLAATQMEATDARRMFPCFDEPQYKATFDLTATIDSHLVAISNSPIVSEKENAKLHTKTVHFAETPKMSTYLVALIVGPMESSEPVEAHGVPIRVWTVAGKKGMGAYAQEFAQKFLDYYDEYFGVPYPAAKLDLIAIPDFEAGAMENLGAITFRESALLVDGKTASLPAKQGVASILAHEMAHMWFGDLVTMKWWDDLWLNEAFATWMATKAVDRIKPEWKEWDRFAAGRVAALYTDCLQSTRPIHFAVSDPTQVSQMFDEITYEKGASILRMLEQYVGETVFRDGVQRYIKEYQFGNARTKDLWEAIGKASAKDVYTIMHGWVYQPGYPLILVGVNGGKVEAQQQRFFLVPRGHSGAFGALWQVPLCFRSLSNSKPEGERFLLDSKLSEFKMERPNEGFVANADGNGYYRVRYTKALLKRLSENLDKLSVTERAQLLSDQYALALSCNGPVEEYLSLTKQYEREEDPTVTGMLIDQLEHIHLLIQEKSRPQFEQLVRSRLIATKRTLGWHPSEGDSSQVISQRQQVLEMLGTTGQDKETIEEARQLFTQYKKDPTSVHPDLLAPMITVVAYNGTEADYNTIQSLWKKATAPELEKRFLFALGLFRQRALMERTLALALTDEVRSQDTPHLIAEIVVSATGRELGWQFVETHWKSITARLSPLSVPHLARAASAMVTEQQEKRLQEFFRATPLPHGTRAVAQTLERVHANVLFNQRAGAALASWLAVPSNVTITQPAEQTDNEPAQPETKETTQDKENKPAPSPSSPSAPGDQSRAEPVHTQNEEESKTAAPHSQPPAEPSAQPSAPSTDQEAPSSQGQEKRSTPEAHPAQPAGQDE